MAIEVIPETKIKKKLWAIVFLVFCLILFSGLLVSYFYIVKLSGEISQEIKNKEKALVKTPSEIALEKELLLYESKINDFEKLLSAHKKSSNIFVFLEETCHPNIWFSDFNFISNSGAINVSGQAEGFMDLGQQLIILKEANVLKEINLPNVSLIEGGEINFTLQLLFDPEIFR